MTYSERHKSKVAWVCVTECQWRGFSKTLARWQGSALPNGAILRSRDTGDCLRFNAETSSFTKCDEPEKPIVPHELDVTWGHKLPGFRAMKVG